MRRTNAAALRRKGAALSNVLNTVGTMASTTQTGAVSTALAVFVAPGCGLH
jgi:hypothetical protein